MTGSIAGRSGWSDDTWSYLNDPRMPAMEHGWKLHLSTRPGDLEAVTALVLPVLLRHVCHAKFAKDPQILRALNSGVSSPGSVGKAITVYPAPTALLALARELVTVLRDREGPQVVSDRRLDPRSPVYYRYGPFTGDYRTGRSGRIESVMVGPDGRLFDGLATGTYRCPPWAEDPFAATAAAAAVAAADRATVAVGLGGGRYRVTAGIVRKPQGNLYRALDRHSGRPVVIKQARAFVAEDESGRDTRDRLRNERTVLAALAPVPGVPRALDHFRHGTDEYLVLTSCGDRDLRREVQEHGPYRPDDTRAWRTPAALATALLRILDAVHARGVVVRDLKPGNVVLDADGRCHLIDFGISELDGAGPGGSTPGYSEPVLRATGPAGPADDHYALGATLYFAATGLDPVIVDAEAAANRERTLDGLAWALPGPGDRALRATIGGLMSLDPAARTAAADRLRSGTPGPAGPSRRARPDRIDRLDPDLLQEIIEHTTGYCVDQAHRIVDPAHAARLHIPTPIDLYGGSSGLGLELLRHPQARESAQALARWTARQSRTLTPAFYSGRTGVELFMAEAGTPADPAPDGPPPEVAALPGPRPDGGAPEADLIEGAAGIGLGRLLLARHARASGRPRLAEHHLAIAAGCERMLASGAAGLTATGADTVGSAALREGLAHGAAGVAYFLLEHGGATGDPATIERATAACGRLAAVTPGLVTAAERPGATRRYGSWCRGLAGIGAVLVRSAALLGEPEHLRLAQRAARTCAALAPRMPLVTQCCGLAGVGELLVDVAAAGGPGAEEFRTAAETTALIILARSGGPRARPTFPDPGLTGPAATWAGGSAGVLAFLRRLHDPTGPRLGFPTTPVPATTG
ncbi:class IV lanthionine synthetase LanL [Kitasatospora sp. NPDC094015]|uniref:class IV lanthionine synthetase LanL n=1 Tax=Kitasatospora sp. NPDC094015 TaxID=3155205 RepID=UPI003325DF7B